MSLFRRRNRRRAAAYCRSNSGPETLETRSLLAATISTAANINLTNSWSHVLESVSVGRNVYFVASDGGNSSFDLWRTNGSNTVRLANLGPADGQSRQLTNVNGTLYFRGFDDASGHELWKTDGSIAGTMLVRELRGGKGSSSLTHFVNHNGTLYFSGNGDLYRSNGQAGGTVRVLDIFPAESDDVSHIVSAGDHFYFRARTGSGGDQLFRSAGTRHSTTAVSAVPPAKITEITHSGGSVYFLSAGRRLHRTRENGVSASLVRDFTGIASPAGLTDLNGTLYFHSHGELFRSDGTSDGTYVVRRVGENISQMYAFGNTLYLAGGTSYDSDGEELWKSDGTASGTVQVRNINPWFDEGYGFGSYPRSFTNVAGTLYFVASDSLWKTDGTTDGTVPVDNGNAFLPANANGQLFFFRTFGAGNIKAMQLSLTTETATEILRPGRGTGSSNPTGMTLHNGNLYFVADDGVTGAELRRRLPDGTIQLVTDLTPGPAGSGISGLVSDGNLLYFRRTQNGAASLWRTDGTAEGTIFLADHVTFAHPTTQRTFTTVNNTLFFAGQSTQGTELWKTDGTAGGTMLVRDIAPGSYFDGYNNFPNSSSPDGLTNVNGTLFFAAFDPVRGRELWKSDGTTAGTVVVKNIFPEDQDSGYDNIYSSFPTVLTNRNGTLHFVARDRRGMRFFTSDGSDAGTVPVGGVIAGLHQIEESVYVGNRLFFVGRNFTTGSELWTSNGTAGGTRLVRDIVPGPGSSAIRDLTAVDDAVYFTATDLTHGRELWRSNGTSAGTVLVRDLRTGTGGPFNQPLSSEPRQLTALNGVLFFSADNGIHGRELWKTNGTSGGLTRSHELVPGQSGTDPGDLVVWNNAVYFAGHSVMGRELFRVRSSPPLLTTGAAAVAWTEGDSGTPVFPQASITDRDNLTFRGGRVVISIVNPVAGDLLEIRHDSRLEIQGQNVLVDGNVIGRLMPTSTASHRVVHLQGDSTPANVEVLLQNILFRSESQNPTSRIRRVRVELSDGDAGRSVRVTAVNVTPVNQAPAITEILTSFSYQRNSLPGVAIAAGAQVDDVDTRIFSGGSLQVSVSGGDESANRLIFQSAQVTVDLSGVVTVMGHIIGTMNDGGGIGTTPLIVSFNSNATLGRVTHLLRSLRYLTESGNSNLDRLIGITLDDGQEGVFALSPFLTVTVSD